MKRFSSAFQRRKPRGFIILSCCTIIVQRILVLSAVLGRRFFFRLDLGLEANSVNLSYYDQEIPQCIQIQKLWPNPENPLIRPRPLAESWHHPWEAGNHKPFSRSIGPEVLEGGSKLEIGVPRFVAPLLPRTLSRRYGMARKLQMRSLASGIFEFTGCCGLSRGSRSEAV